MGSNQSKQFKEDDEGQNLTAAENEKDEALTIGVQETWKEFSDSDKPCQMGLTACPCNESERQQPMCPVKIGLITSLVILLLLCCIAGAAFGYFYWMAEEADLHSWFRSWSIKFKFDRE